MNQSDQVNELFLALSGAQGDGMAALKDATGQIGQQKTKYADLASCWDACRKPLATHGLSVVQVTSADGPKVTVETILGHKSGQWISGSLTMTSASATPQAIGSAITYARRYALCSIVGIAPEDDDGAAASSGGSKEAQRQVAQRKIAEMKARAEGNLGVSEVDIIEAHPEQPSALAQQLTDSIAQVQESCASKKPDKFAALKNFRELKEKIVAETGSDQVYYVGLEAAGYRKSNEIPADDLRRSYKLVMKEFTDWKSAQPPITSGSIEGRKLQKETA